MAWFYIFYSNAKISLVGCFGLNANSILEAEAEAMRISLLHLHLNNLFVRYVFLTNDELAVALKNVFHYQNWRANALMENIDNAMRSLGEIKFHTIPRRWLWLLSI